MVLTLAGRHEGEGLCAALREGRVDGSQYEGPCACLVGTLANVRGVPYTAIPGLEPDGNRPSERWYMGIRKGDTPETNPVAALSLAWAEEWLRLTAPAEAIGGRVSDGHARPPVAPVPTERLRDLLDAAYAVVEAARETDDGYTAEVNALRGAADDVSKVLAEAGEHDFDAVELADLLDGRVVPDDDRFDHEERAAEGGVATFRVVSRPYAVEVLRYLGDLGEDGPLYDGEETIPVEGRTAEAVADLVTQAADRLLAPSPNPGPEARRA